MAKILIIIELLILSFVGVRHFQKQEEVRNLQYLQEGIKNWQEFLSAYPQFQPGQLHLQQLQQALPPQPALP